MGWASDTTAPTASWLYDESITGSTTTAGWIVYSRSEHSTTMVLEQLPDLPLARHALPRSAQLEELARLASNDRRRESPRERARFGWHDAPRRPCFRAVRVR